MRRVYISGPRTVAGPVRGEPEVASPAAIEGFEDEIEDLLASPR